MEEMTLHICLFGTRPEGFDDVVAEAEERLRDTLNVPSILNSSLR